MQLEKDHHGFFFFFSLSIFKIDHNKLLPWPLVVCVLLHESLLFPALRAPKRGNDLIILLTLLAANNVTQLTCFVLNKQFPGLLCSAKPASTSANNVTVCSANMPPCLLARLFSWEKLVVTFFLQELNGVSGSMWHLPTTSSDGKPVVQKIMRRAWSSFCVSPLGSTRRAGFRCHNLFEILFPGYKTVDYYGIFGRRISTGLGKHGPNLEKWPASVASDCIRSTVGQMFARQAQGSC